MRNPSPYLRLRVIGAVDMAPGSSIRDRIRHVAQMTFTDEDGNPRVFTWRTISTWLYRYKSQGGNALQTKTRSDKGTRRKIVPERVLEAIEQVRASFRGKSYRLSHVYRACIEQGVLRREEIAPNTLPSIEATSGGRLDVNEEKHGAVMPKTSHKTSRRRTEVDRLDGTEFE